MLLWIAVILLYFFTPTELYFMAVSTGLTNQSVLEEGWSKNTFPQLTTSPYSAKHFPPNPVVSDVTIHMVRKQGTCPTYILRDRTFISLYQCMSRRKRWFPPVKFRPTPPASNETNITFKGQKRVKKPVSRKLMLHILHILIWTKGSVYPIYIRCVYLLCIWELARCYLMKHRSMDMEIMAQRGQPTIPCILPWYIFTD